MPPAPAKNPPTLAHAVAALQKLANPAKVATYRNFFKNCRDDTFLGVTTPLCRQLAKEYRDLPLAAVRTLMQSRVHDERSLAHKILVLQYQKADEAGQAKLHQFYLKNRGCIRDWDGVDDSAPYLVGEHLLDRDKALLYELILSPSQWDRRIALVSTWPLIQAGKINDTLKLAALVLGDEADLIHKAAGWMLREVGKKDVAALRNFLEKHRADMPRTMLRYAIERFTPAERARWLKRA